MEPCPSKDETNQDNQVNRKKERERHQEKTTRIIEMTVRFDQRGVGRDGWYQDRMRESRTAQTHVPVSVDGANEEETKPRVGQVIANLGVANGIESTG